jgi:hypothetical protein
LMNANGCRTLLSRSLSSRTYQIFQARRSTVGKRPQADRATDVLVPMQYQQARSNRELAQDRHHYTVLDELE